MNWLTETIIILTPLSLGIIILGGMALGWTIYGLRGYRHWVKRFNRYHLPTRRGNRKARKIVRPNYGYVEYVPEVVNAPIMTHPIASAAPVIVPAPVIQKRAPQIINKQTVAQASPVAAPTTPLRSTKDDLQVIEGIGPKIEKILNDNGIYTWRELAMTPGTNTKAMLERAGKSFGMHDPTTWAEQARMADIGDWDELKAYQEFLHKGKE